MNESRTETVLQDLLDELKQNPKGGAFDELYKLLADRLYRTARRRGLLHQDAEDAVHETFIRVLLNAHRYDRSKESRAGAMIWMIHRRCVINQWRRLAQDSPLDDPDVLEEGNDSFVPSAEDQYESERAIAAEERCHNAAMRELTPEEQKEIQRKPRGRPSDHRLSALGHYDALYYPCIQAAVDEWGREQ